MSEERDRILAALRGVRYSKSEVASNAAEEIANIIECACILEGALYRSTGKKGRIDEYSTELFNLRKALEGVFGSDIPCDGYGEEQTDE